MRAAWTLGLAGLALLVWAESSSARVHGQMYCWGLDSELPLPCEEEAEEDDADPTLQGSPGGPTRSPKLGP